VKIQFGLPRLERMKEKSRMVGGRLKKRYLTEARREAWWALGFLAPFLIIFIVWQIYPLLYGLGLSFTNLDLLKASEVKFVGLTNYTKIFSDSFVGLSLNNTLIFTVASVGLGVLMSLGLASSMNGNGFGAKWLKWVCFIPYLMGASAISIIWKRIYMGHSGPLNVILTSLGFPNAGFLNDVNLAMPSVIVVSIWVGLGFNGLVLLSGMQNIPNEVKEAAMIDGASRWQTFWLITMPLLRPILFFVITYAFIGAFQAFGLVYALTSYMGDVLGGDPLYHTLTFVMYIYGTAFRKMNLGYGAALSWLLFAIIFALTVVERRVLGTEE
jgi:multiple sugar transport system permease protein